MLIEFKLSNFRSFNDEQTFSMVAAEADASHSSHLVDLAGASVVKVAAIYGANASGKSNLIKALAFVQRLVRTSASRMNVSDRIRGLAPFRLDLEREMQPSTFQTCFAHGGSRYVYGFSARVDRVLDEWLFRASAQDAEDRIVFSREFDAGANASKWDLTGIAPADRDLLMRTTRDNGLALSCGAQLNITPLIDPFVWFGEKLLVKDLSEQKRQLVRLAARRIREDPGFGEQITSLLKDADLGIEGVRVVEGVWEERPLDLASREEGSVWATHRIRRPASTANFDFFQEESLGTQRFFALGALVLDALDRGRVLVLDEFDSSLHPLLSRKLIELFQSEGVETGQAQLILATQDSTILDPVLFRRDQIWLVEKNADAASELASLSDFRMDEGQNRSASLQRDYLSGRFGAIPRFGPTFEDLELKERGERRE